jgi:hypothetical protein
MADDGGAIDTQHTSDGFDQIDQLRDIDWCAIGGIRCQSAAWEIEADQRVAGESILGGRGEKIALRRAEPVEIHDHAAGAWAREARDREVTSAEHDASRPIVDGVAHDITTWNVQWAFAVRAWQKSLAPSLGRSHSARRAVIHWCVSDPRYPIGRFDMDAPLDVSPGARAHRIEALARLPQRFRAAFAGVTTRDLERRYRAGGWMLWQVAHHVSDSHMNGLVRFKLALTEEVPTFKAFDEHAWANLGDAKSVPIEVSFDLLDALHTRWVALLTSMSPSDFERRFVHPGHQKFIVLDSALALYAWHGEHHLAHVRLARQG